MLFDLIALVVLLLFVAIGAFRGTIAGLVSTATLVVGYIVGALCAVSLGAPLGEAIGQSRWIAAPLAGSLGFFAVFVVMAIVAFFIRRWDRARVEAQGGRSALDRTGGALCGAFRGLLVVLLIGILHNWIQASQIMNGSESVESAETTPLQHITQNAVEAGLGALLGDQPQAEIATQMIARPTQSLVAMRDVMEHPAIATLVDDKNFWVYVENGAYDSALNRQSFHRMLRDPNLRSDLADVGFVDPAAAGDPVLFRRATLEVLEQVGPRIANLRSDPEMRGLAEDPEIVDLLQRNDILGLLRNPRFSAFVNRVLETPAQGS